LYTGFCGIGSYYVENLREAYSKTPIFQVGAPPFTKDLTNFDLNFALSSVKSSQFTSHLITWEDSQQQEIISGGMNNNNELNPASILAAGVDCGLSSARSESSLATISSILTNTGATYLHEIQMGLGDTKLPTKVGSFHQECL